MDGVSTKSLTNTAGDSEVEVPPGGVEKFQGLAPPAAAATAPSHSRDWGLAAIPQQDNAGGGFGFDAESPEID